MIPKLGFAMGVCAMVAIFCGIGITLIFVVWIPLGESERQVIQAMLSERLMPAIFVFLVGIALIAAVMYPVYQRYTAAPLRLREHLLILLESHPEARLPLEGPPEFRSLAFYINALADQRDSLRHDIDARIREASAELEEEKDRFAALISELNQGVIACNADGRVLLYNSQARALFQGARENEAASPATGMIGLGRSIFGVVDRDLITHALERIRYRIEQGSTRPVASFVTTTQTDQLIRVHMAPVVNAPHARRTDAGPEIPALRTEMVNGFVLILDNITRSVETDSRRDDLLQTLTEGSRAGLANTQAAVENLLHYPDMDVEHRERFHRVMREEVGRMSENIERAGSAFTQELRVRWPLEEMRGSDFVQAVQRRIEQRLSLSTKTEQIAETLWIKVDSFSLMQAITYLAARLKEEFQIRELRFQLTPQGRLAHLDLIWTGTVIGTETLSYWEQETMRFDGQASPLTVREVVERHGGELWFQRDRPSHRSYFRMLLPIATAPDIQALTISHPESRPEFYDFDLFRQTDETKALSDRPLSELTYTAFDTETTGLNPSAGDEIIQIGAARIVNGRLLKTEIFDCMIDPMRRISAESTRIHGITEAALRGQPTIAEVLPVFHTFCEDTVLIAHNAAFDMRFLQIKESVTGIRFRQPVLDTLLLSAVVHPNQESHTLEAIALRLGIDIVGRHTALGDAIVTGEVFLKMIPLLAEQGISTLRQAQEAAKTTFFAKVKY